MGGPAGFHTLLRAALEKVVGAGTVVTDCGADNAVEIAGADAPPATLVIGVGSGPEHEPVLKDFTARGVDGVVFFYPRGKVALRVWDRFAWKMEERDFVDPATFDSFCLSFTTERRNEDAARLVITNTSSGARAVVGYRA